MTLIQIILQSYTSILLVIGVFAAIAFTIGLYFIIRCNCAKSHDQLTLNIPAEPKASFKAEKLVLPDAAHDVTAISGEDPMATQLDLARAYIETGKNQFAKIILKTVIREGSKAHQEEAQRLLGSI